MGTWNRVDDFSFELDALASDIGRYGIKKRDVRRYCAQYLHNAIEDLSTTGHCLKIFPIMENTQRLYAANFRKEKLYVWPVEGGFQIETTDGRSDTMTLEHAKRELSKIIVDTLWDMLT